MDLAIFFQQVRQLLFQGRLSDAQVSGMEAILDAWEKYAPHSDRRFIAYALATAYHETAQTMQPIKEYGRGQGKSYGAPTGPKGRVYYGRGFVQLTWLANYKKATTALQQRNILKPSESLVDTPSLALQDDIAAAILVLGMLEGWFTGRRLDQFFKGTRSDWVDARAIINGKDKSALIASYGLQFYHALTAADDGSQTTNGPAVS